jgi:AcrR family transcriptional regulator
MNELRAGNPRGPYAKSAARRQQILDRALVVFARGGSDRTSLRAIAEEVNVTHAALKHYFGSLEELLVEVYRESERERSRQGSPDPARTPVESMRESARRNREIAGLVQLYSTLVASALEDGHPSAREFATSRFAHMRAEMAARVRVHQDAGRMRADVDPETVAALVIAASDGLQTHWLLDPTAPQDAALTLLDALLSTPSE